MDFNVYIFLFGCFGAAAPEIVRIYKTRKFGFDLTFLNGCVSLAFFFIGGIVAIALESPTLYSAFYSGVAAPIIISSLGQSSPALPKKATTDTDKSIGLIMAENRAHLNVRQYFGIILS